MIGLCCSITFCFTFGIRASLYLCLYTCLCKFYIYENISAFIRVCANFIFMKICNAVLIFYNARYFGLTFLLGFNTLKLFYNNFDVFCVFK